MIRGTRNKYMSPYSPPPMAQAENFGDMYLLRVPKFRAIAANGLTEHG